ncbi:MAG: tripartite tricarboxylate transporter substrate binding protein [Desulfurococcales archaeon]|nr:tripartite tricarboxylate transporter substrate binding protein [Desulfurococcales archaeon]
MVSGSRALSKMMGIVLALIVLVIVVGVAGYYAGSSIASVRTVTVTLTAPTTPPTTPAAMPAVMWPTRAVYVIVGWGVGGGTDIFARAVAPILQNLTGVPWVVVNMPGASGAIAEDYVVKQPADGYTVLFAPNTMINNIITGTNKNPLSSYIPIALFQWDVGALWIRADDKRFKNIDEFLKYAKDNEVKIGGTGIGSTDHINVYLFIKYSGIKGRYIPYERAGDMHKDLLGGSIDAMYEEPGIVYSLYEGGKIKPLFFYHSERLKEFPDIPAITEYGWNITLGVWRGVFVRAGTPPEIVEKLIDLCTKAYNSPEYKEFEKRQLLHYRSKLLVGDEFKKFIEKELEIYSKILKELGIVS